LNGTKYTEGMRFFNYITIKKSDNVISSNGNKYTAWICLCDCGSEFVARTKEIKKGRKSCGCMSTSNRFKKVSPSECITNIKINHYKSSATRRNLDFSIDRDEFFKLITGNCNYCGSPPSTKIKRHSHTMEINGIDRINTKVGYVVGNVTSCCKSCNYAKSDLTMEEFEKWINNLIAYRTNGK